jgi:hypothetical protein
VTWSCGLVRPPADALEPRRMRPELRPARPRALLAVVVRDVAVRCRCSAPVPSAKTPAAVLAGRPAAIKSDTPTPIPGCPGICPVTARTLQGMARVRPGRLLPDPYLLVRSVRRGSRVKRDFACTFTRLFPPVLVVLRSQSRLRLEGRTCTLSGPSPDLSPVRTFAPSAGARPICYGWSWDEPVCQPEKRKVGSSTLPLTTSFGLVCSALTSENADWALSCQPPSSDHDYPCVTMVGRSLSHADRTSCLRALGSRPLCPELAAPLGVWPSPQLTRCAGGRAGWWLSGDVAVRCCCTAPAASAKTPAAVLAGRRSAFRPDTQRLCSAAPGICLVTARTFQGMAPCPGQAFCLALGFWPECFRRLSVKGGRRSFPEETRSALDSEGKHVTIQGPSPGLSPASTVAPPAGPAG